MTAEDSQKKQLAELLAFLRDSRGFDFTGYKPQSLVRRLNRRMREIGVATFSEYLDYLQVHPDEFVPLFDTVLINVTSFFRDAEAWRFLAANVLPSIIEEGGPIRAWSAGCASGPEPYTLAMLLAEAMGPAAFSDRVKIFATDADEGALVAARSGTYTAKEVEPIAPELRGRYLTASNGRFAVRSDLRRAVSFGRHDLIQDAPISRLDLLICRNTLMYFDAETQARVLARFGFALKSTGLLFLGKAEMLFSHAQVFAPVSLKHRLFRRVGPPPVRDRVAAMAPFTQATDPERAARRSRLRNLAIEVSPLAILIVDADGTLTEFNERARTLFSISDRDVGRPLQDLEVSYRPLELRARLDEAYASRRSVRAEAERPAADGGTQRFVVHFTPLSDGGAESLGAVVSYEEVTELIQLQDDLTRSKEQLETALGELQSTNEELETTNEELQSTNEELETTNEELQSTNEELETMNAELQSSNEELDSINRQLQERTQSLEASASFLESVFSSVQAGLVVVGRELEVLVWNPRAEDLWGIREKEAKGAPFFSLEFGLPLEPLREPLQGCLEGRENPGDVWVAGRTRLGRDVECRVSCTPLVGCVGRAEGVIVMMETRHRDAG